MKNYRCEKGMKMIYICVARRGKCANQYVVIVQSFCYTDVLGGFWGSSIP